MTATKPHNRWTVFRALCKDVELVPTDIDHHTGGGAPFFDGGDANNMSGRPNSETEGHDSDDTEHNPTDPQFASPESKEGDEEDSECGKQSAEVIA
jgi:hypothetical protein